MLSDLKRKAKRGFHRLRTPIGPSEMRSALARLMGEGSDVLFAHTSLSSCGRFTAGAGDVLQGLREFSDTLSLPTHTYCYPLAPGEPGPLFDPALTPSQNGVLTEMFRKQPRVLRSISATHSLAAIGPFAQVLCDGHYLLDTPCGAGTPYRRLIEQKASVLLFGVTFHCYTLYHTAEDASGSEFAYERETRDRLCVVDEIGKQRDCWARRQTRDLRRFAECGDLLQRVGLARRTELGRGILLFAPDCAKVHDFLVERLRKIPNFLHMSCVAPLT